MLLHGFPELGFSWRKVMGAPGRSRLSRPSLPTSVAMGGRPAGRTVTNVDLEPYGAFNLVRDVMGLVFALGRQSVAAVIGHDFGSPLAAWCGMIRPDGVSRGRHDERAVRAAPRRLPVGPGRSSGTTSDIFGDLAKLSPPRKHYQRYYQTAQANGDMMNAPQGLHAFLRGYYHCNERRLGRVTVRTGSPLGPRTSGPRCRRTTSWIWTKAWERPLPTSCRQRPRFPRSNGSPDAELAVCATEFGRTTFQGGPQSLPGLR